MEGKEQAGRQKPQRPDLWSESSAILYRESAGPVAPALAFLWLTLKSSGPDA